MSSVPNDVGKLVVPTKEGLGKTAARYVLHAVIVSYADPPCQPGKTGASVERQLELEPKNDISYPSPTTPILSFSTRNPT